VIASADELTKRFGRSQVIARYSDIIQKEISRDQHYKSGYPAGSWRPIERTKQVKLSG
jgi:hypothetical protein